MSDTPLHPDGQPKQVGEFTLEEAEAFLENAGAPGTIEAMWAASCGPAGITLH